MLSPGITEYPDHKVRTEKITGRVEIFMDGEKVVDTVDALRLYEDGHEPRVYVPRSSLRNIELLKFDDYHCPFKGRAELLNVKHGPVTHENAAWSYRQTYDDMNEIENFVAFYPNRLQECRITG